VSTVLIASPEHLNVLKNRSDLAEAQAFPDAEALRALELITRQRPSVVALERLFAATSRGTALINRIKADPALSGCEIRIVTHDGPAAAAAAGPVNPAPAAGGATPAPAPAPAPLDQRGTRRAPRTPIAGTVEVLVDGNPVALVDVSVIGAQVISPSILRPNQRIRVTLPDPGRPIRVVAGVAWASFEMPKAGPRYRAGIEFFDADATAVGSWVAKVAG
jgi:hypothetical protein